MANELKYTYASQVTVAGYASEVNQNTISTATSATLTATNHSNYPLADAVLTFSTTASMSSASNYINLYRRDLDIDGASDEPALSTTAGSEYKHHFVGTFVARASSAGQASVAHHLPDVPLTQNCEFYIENKCNVPIGANWTLKITPKSYVPGS